MYETLVCVLPVEVHDTLVGLPHATILCEAFCGSLSQVPKLNVFLKVSLKSHCYQYVSTQFLHLQGIPFFILYNRVVMSPYLNY